MSRPSAAHRHFFVHAAYRSSVLGVELENADRLRGKFVIFTADPRNPGFPPYPETPRFRHIKKNGRLPRDIDEYSGYWLVSARMKTLLELIDPRAFVFVACDLTLSDGTSGPELWLCDVVRVLDALDEAASTVKIEITSGLKRYHIRQGQTLIFRAEDLGEAHVFRMRYATPWIVCDETFRTACKTTGIRNIEFSETRA